MSPRIPSLRSRRGNYMMTMGSFLPILVGFAALSVDISYINMARSQAQHVADAASHGAYVAYRATNSTTAGNDAANFILDTNLVGNQRATLQQLTFGNWDFNALNFTPGGNINSAEAIVSRLDADGNALELFFAPLLGKDKQDVQALGVTAGRSRELIIVMDTSGSFSGQIGDARVANVAFLDYIKSRPVPGDMVGMTLFSGRATYDPLYPLAPVATDYGPMRSAFQTLTTCGSHSKNPSGASWPTQGCYTNQARGLLNALDQFQRPIADSDNFQAIILFSDGLPNTTLKSAANGNEYNVDPPVDSQADAEFMIDAGWSGGTYTYDNWTCSGTNTGCQVRNEARTEVGGIHVWTVTLCQSNGSACDPDKGDYAWMGTLPRGLGQAYLTPNSTQLEAIMVEIASSVPMVLTK